MGYQESLNIHDKVKELESQLEHVKKSLIHVYETNEMTLREQFEETFAPLSAQVKYLGNYDKSWGEMRVAKEGDACFDLYAAIDEPIFVEAGEWVVVPNGFKIDVGYGKELQIRPRSGLAAKYGITVLNAPGTVDSGYRGEVMTPIINLGQKVYTIYPGDRIAQATIKHARDVQLISVDELDVSERGEGGFGHTGA